MNDFNGSNKTKTSFKSYFDRTKWDFEAYLGSGTENEPKMSKKFSFTEKHLFGLVDLEKKPVEPITDNLEPFPLSMTDGEYLTAIPFFRNQVMDLKKTLDSVKFSSCPRNNQWINNLRIYRAYEPPQDLYTKHLTSIVTDFIDNGIYSEDDIGKRFRSYNITRFDHFVNNFLSFCELKYQNQPILYSSWYMSGKNSMYSSGLRVKISDLEYGEDKPLYKQIINTPEFNYYKQAVQSVGLAFDFNDPSVLTPDFGSPLIKPYVPDDFNVFEFYHDAYDSDFNLLYNILINLYNTYVNKQDKVIKFSDSCGKLKWNFLQLQLAPIEPDLDDLPIYLKIKSVEDLSLNNKQLATLKKNSLFLEKRFDKNTAIGYINDIYLNLYYSKPFSFKVLYNKIVLKKQKEQEQIGTNIFGGNGGSISSY